MARFAAWLSGFVWMHHVVAALRIYPIAGTVLRRFPMRRKIHGLVYRITSLDQLSIEYEMFHAEIYRPAIDNYEVRSFIDLGCNAGWFPLWLAYAQPMGDRFGLIVDAQPRMCSEAKWTLQHNNVGRCVVLHGAVGVPSGIRSATLHVHPSSSASSLREIKTDSQFPVKGRVKDIAVPVLSVSEEWHQLFGESPVDLLKVDIEGAELDLIASEGEFLARFVRRIVIEWHKGFVELRDLDVAMKSIGFNSAGVFGESDLTGLGLYSTSLSVLGR